VILPVFKTGGRRLSAAMVGSTPTRFRQVFWTKQGILLNGNPRYVFWNGTSQPESATGLWQEDLRTLMKAAGLWIKGNVSHRSRDTAVDFWLSQGWTLTDVADALGDTVAVVERHYKSLESKRAEERLAKLPVRTWSATQ
jgi:hypothetical protein